MQQATGLWLLAHADVGHHLLPRAVAGFVWQQHTLDQDFELATAGLLAEQPGLHHLRVVEHQQVAAAQQSGQFAEDAVHWHRPGAVEQARGAAFGGGVLGDEFVGEREIEIGDGECARRKGRSVHAA
ncbi:hypothetical protein D9M69_691860 [compost metagenome]